MNVQWKVSWLEYYQAVKKGDLEKVIAAKDKDFRITLTMDKCALELAALHGHKNLVGYFLQESYKTMDFELVVESLKNSLRGGYLEIAELIMAFLGPVEDVNESYVDVPVVLAAVVGKNLECLELVWEKAKSKYKGRYAECAFATGSRDVVEFIRDHGVDEYNQFGEGPLPTYFDRLPRPHYFAALGDYESLKAHRDLTGQRSQCDYDSTRGKFAYTDTRLVRCTLIRERDEFETVEVAATFGQVDILKALIIDMDISNVNVVVSDPDWSEKLYTVVRLALRFNHRNVLEYLVGSNFWPVMPPHEYEAFRINEAFAYLKEQTQLDESEELSDTFMKNFIRFSVANDRERLEPTLDENLCRRSVSYCPHNTPPQQTRIDEYYEYLLNCCGTNIKKLDLGSLFMQALSEQNVDAALCLQKRLKTVDCRTMMYHVFLTTAMSGVKSPFPVITSPIVVELILSTLRGARSCSCACKLNPLKAFLEPIVMDFEFEIGSQQVLSTDRRLPKISLDLFVKRSEVVLDVLLGYGLDKPDSCDILRLISSYFKSQRHLAVTGAKILTTLQCAKVDVGKIDVKNSSMWFRANWPERNTFLTEFLISLYRNGGSKTVSVRAVLAYIFQCRDREIHFLRCLKETGITLDDFWVSKKTDVHISEGGRTNMLTKGRNSPKERLFSLEECARFAVHRHALNRAANEISTYLSVKSVVNELIKDLHLPKSIKDFLLFLELYKRSTFEDGGYYKYKGLLKRVSKSRLDVNHADF